jgi:hypothetical protein
LNLAFKTLEVIADSHGQGEEFFEGMLGRGELDDDPAGFETDARRQICELLVEGLGGGFDQKAGPLTPLLFEFG